MEKKKKERKLCPTCGNLGSGPYARWVLNWQKKRYVYNYFAHKIKKNGKWTTKWCYITKSKTSLEPSKP